MRKGRAIMSQKQAEQEALKNYDSTKYKTPDGYTADIAIFTIISEKIAAKAPPNMTLKIMLIKRALKSSEGEANIEGGKWALPGGFVDAMQHETAYIAAERELKEETNVEGLFLKHFSTYDAINRDPRGWMISNAFYAIVPEDKLKQRRAEDDAMEVALFDIDEVFKLKLAFDHEKIIKDALAVMKREMLQTTIVRNFLPKEFTLSELQGVLLTLGEDSRIANDSLFFTKIPKLAFVEKVVDENGVYQKTNRHSYRPSQLYYFNDINVDASIYF